MLHRNTYQAKKIVCPLGFEVEKIHACRNNYMLFHKGQCHVGSNVLFVGHHDTSEMLNIPMEMTCRKTEKIKDYRLRWLGMSS
jgi:hypothetical protein